MIFFGWGKRSKVHEIEPGRALVRTFGYVHLFWLFRVSWPAGASLATATDAGWAQAPVTAADAAALDPEGRATIHWWWRWGLLVAVGILVLLVVVSEVFTDV